MITCFQHISSHFIYSSFYYFWCIQISSKFVILIRIIVLTFSTVLVIQTYTFLNLKQKNFYHRSLNRIESIASSYRNNFRNVTIMNTNHKCIEPCYFKLFWKLRHRRLILDNKFLYVDGTECCSFNTKYWEYIKSSG